MTSLVVAALLAAGAAAQEPPAPDASDLLDALLAGLLGQQEEETPEALQARVAEVGGVPFRAAVPLNYLEPAGLASYLRQLVDAEYPPELADADARTLAAFGLLDPGTDLRAVRTKLLLENVVGFYDDRPGHRRLFAVSDTRSLTPTNRIVLVHELRHALQDQYADLHAALPKSVGDFDDRRIALMSVLEGDATLVMMRYLEGLFPLGGALGDAALPVPPIEGVPAVLRDQLARPYVDGLNLARALHERGGWAALREAWSKPPRSTEQVLHSDKLFAREEPREVVIPWSPAGGRVLAEGVLGELLAGTLLGGGGAATEGWGGDAYRTWDLNGATLLVWRAVWDTPQDEAEFRDALRARFEPSHGPGVQKGPFRAFTRTPWRLAVGGPPGTVLLVSSDAGAAFERAIAELGAR
ncbi:MAG TPA: hypothetical protein VFM88_11495 [Vicinamibacteria bacterium]|nr:hypothetical protein [Vicinamibacteria bacterium]